jgi:hypothetical protein
MSVATRKLIAERWVERLDSICARVRTPEERSKLRRT